MWGNDSMAPSCVALRVEAGGVGDILRGSEDSGVTED